MLNLQTQIVYSIKDPDTEVTSEIIRCVKQNNCTEYFSGPHGKSYLKTELFQKENVKLEFQDSTYFYYNYPTSIVSTISQIGLIEVLRLLSESKK
jgi:hypothetical protein